MGASRLAHGMQAAHLQQQQQPGHVVSPHYTHQAAAAAAMQQHPQHMGVAMQMQMPMQMQMQHHYAHMQAMQQQMHPGLPGVPGAERERKGREHPTNTISHTLVCVCVVVSCFPPFPRFGPRAGVWWAAGWFADPSAAAAEGADPATPAADVDRLGGAPHTDTPHIHRRAACVYVCAGAQLDRGSQSFRCWQLAQDTRRKCETMNPPPPSLPPSLLRESRCTRHIILVVVMMCCQQAYEFLSTRTYVDLKDKFVNLVKKQQHVVTDPSTGKYVLVKDLHQHPALHQAMQQQQQGIQQPPPMAHTPPQQHPHPHPHQQHQQQQQPPNQ